MRDYVYHDRKMMKWMPFNALLEQGDYINDLLHGRERKTMPTLSPDQEAELNYNLENAYLFGSQIRVVYYETHQFKTITGTIHQIDPYNKLIFVAETALNAMQIIEIEIL